MFLKLKPNELIADIPGYEGLYAVTSLGRIWAYQKNLSDNRVLFGSWRKTQLNKVGNRVVILTDRAGKKKMFGIHRLVAEAFIPNPNQFKVVSHIDGCKWNVKVANLYWKSRKQKC